jgi:hypothetical protein
LSFADQSFGATAISKAVAKDAPFHVACRIIVKYKDPE